MSQGINKSFTLKVTLEPEVGGSSEVPQSEKKGQRFHAERMVYTKQKVRNCLLGD